MPARGPAAAGVPARCPAAAGVPARGPAAAGVPAPCVTVAFRAKQPDNASCASEPMAAVRCAARAFAAGWCEDEVRKYEMYAKCREACKVRMGLREGRRSRPLALRPSCPLPAIASELVLPRPPAPLLSSAPGLCRLPPVCSGARRERPPALLPLRTRTILRDTLPVLRLDLSTAWCSSGGPRLGCCS